MNLPTLAPMSSGRTPPAIKRLHLLEKNCHFFKRNATILKKKIVAFSKRNLQKRAIYNKSNNSTIFDVKTRRFAPWKLTSLHPQNSSICTLKTHEFSHAIFAQYCIYSKKSLSKSTQWGSFKVIWAIIQVLFWKWWKMGINRVLF